VAPFAELLAHPSMAGVPVVVETPSELDGSPSAGHARDIALLCALRDGVTLGSSAA
jgi:deoxyribonuclease-4